MRARRHRTTAKNGATSNPESLLTAVGTRFDEADTRLVERAYRCAAKWHQGHRRLSGDPYICHLADVATTVAEFGLDTQTVCAALLHDLPPEPLALHEVRQEFGTEVAALVHQIGRLNSDASVTPAPDHRAVMVKVADRLHNMLTVRHLPKPQQVRKSHNTLEVVVPLARSLGIATIQEELENLARATLAAREREGRIARRAVCMIVTILPRDSRSRWLDEWIGELHVLPTRRGRAAFTLGILRAAPRLAVLRWRGAKAGTP